MAETLLLELSSSRRRLRSEPIRDSEAEMGNQFKSNQILNGIDKMSIVWRGQRTTRRLTWGESSGTKEWRTNEKKRLRIKEDNVRKRKRYRGKQIPGIRREEGEKFRSKKRY